MPRRPAPHRGTDVHYGDAGPDADDGPDDDGSGRPSKSAAKRHAHALQTLGAAVAALPVSRLATLDMPERLRTAITELRRTKSHEGRRRQMQLVGKLMRMAEEEPLREAVAAFEMGSAKDTLALHEAERWRAELMASDDALTRWLQLHPDTDTQQLRSLVRAARRDAEQAAAQAAISARPDTRQPKSVRDLFQFIKPQLSQATAAADADADADAEADSDTDAPEEDGTA